MDRKMVGFHQDTEAHWVAELGCGHQQHVRHQPPFTLRPWVLSAEGRAERLGQSLACVKCDRQELPLGYAPYRKTPEFTAATVPPMLLRQHSLKPGTWGVLHVLRGELEYVVEGPNETRVVLHAGEQARVLPEVEHHVTLREDAQFFVELWRRDVPAAQ